ncbi:aminopeptidase P family N-terminal domain-containing protein [Amycolatopsis sp. FDAARGOS 1241]|uniref:aminopeptidase P family N-terminal domain-containing protein n=1 Tax=Amycolatopsis sp. FDAARGOS 1241 TaxID=2778070 RepID=UPI001951A8DB|nr:aminopeptidase P family N-terminal domain-containing protein [Amycolatopsis sp. FDAARGOS 1241]QRP43651.1 aminopeptidase P family N-terminal domain-containing protein [Amycolatopsis sp. FDAARGOS 1241]
MKRGLHVLDPAEIPEQEWQDRVAALQRAMAAQGVDVALVYADVSRSDDLAYLTNLCLYWNEGVLAIPAEGPVTFLTKLSLRVQNWMKRSSTVTEFSGGKNFADLVAKYLLSKKNGTLGLIDAALWPADVAEEIVDAVPGWQVRRLGGLVREQRLIPSAAETELLRAAGRILDDAAAKATVEGSTAGSRVETVERALRGGGFLDLYPSSLSTSDAVTSFGVTGQYRMNWVHSSRVLGDGEGWPAALKDALAKAIAAAKAGATVGSLAEAAAPALAKLPEGAKAEVRWVNQADLSTGGEFRNQDAATVLADGEAGAVSVEVAFADGGNAAVAETVRVTHGEPEHLTGAQR